jgi:hypothetical protein
MQYPTFRNAAIAIASVGLLAACDRNDGVIAPQALTSRATLALEVSDAAATGGQRIAIDIANASSAALGGIQGDLSFDPSRLRYRGQLRDASSSQIMMVNSTDAANGHIRLAVLEADGLERSMPLVFDVIGGGYASSLTFKVQEAALNGSPIERVDARIAAGVSINAALSTSADAKPMTMQDWKNVVDAGHASAEPGEIRNGLKFGDTNFDGSLTLSDALYVINVSVGTNEMIVGTDGTGASGDRDAVVAGNVFPFNGTDLGEASDVLAPGVEADGTRVLSLGDGLAIINEFVGVNQAVVGEVIPGRPSTPVSNRVTVSGNISTNTTWTASNIYELSNAVTVTGGATLTIEAGTRIEGATGTGSGTGGVLFIARDGKINAVGTPLQPIVMTCTAAVKSKGCWGGLTILGNASLNDGVTSSPAIGTPGSADFRAVSGCREKQAEGPAGYMYGGCNDDDNSGTVKYVRVEYAGFRFTATNELNGIALNGVGRGTTIDYVQVHAGLDDGMEFFGGTVNVKHLYLTANEDDSFDYTEGWSGNAQFVVIQHDSLDSDKGLEMDNYEFAHDATPRATPYLYNFTVVGKAFVSSTSGIANNNSVGGLHVRRGTRPKMKNFLVQNFPFAMDIDDASTCTDWTLATGFQLTNSIFTQNGRLDASDTGDPACEANESAAILLASNNNLTPSSSPLLSPLDVMVPDFRPAFGTATGGATPLATPIGAPAGFFDVTATYIGAVAPANATKSNVPWYAGWTRSWQSSSTP